MLGRRSLLGLLSGLAAGGAAGGCTSAPDHEAHAKTAPRTPPAVGDSKLPMTQTYAYGDHPSQFAELTLPAGRGTVPIVVIIHGGFWRTAYGAELGRPLAQDLTARGLATLNVEYRRVGTSRTAGGGGWPQTCLDVAAAVDALAVQNDPLADGRLDLSRVVGLGHSAGGQLVGWLAARGALTRPAPGADPAVRLTGIVAQAGVMDLVTAAEEGVGGTAVSDLMGGPPDQLARSYSLASPVARLPLHVRSVCVHGESDEVVPISQSAHFVAEAQRLGDTSDLRRFSGGHFDVITVGSPAWASCAQAVTDLLT